MDPPVYKANQSSSTPGPYLNCRPECGVCSPAHLFHLSAVLHFCHHRSASPVTQQACYLLGDMCLKDLTKKCTGADNPLTRASTGQIKTTIHANKTQDKLTYEANHKIMTHYTNQQNQPKINTLTIFKLMDVCQVFCIAKLEPQLRFCFRKMFLSCW